MPTLTERVARRAVQAHLEARRAGEPEPELSPEHSAWMEIRLSPLEIAPDALHPVKDPPENDEPTP